MILWVGRPWLINNKVSKDFFRRDTMKNSKNRYGGNPFKAMMKNVNLCSRTANCKRDTGVVTEIISEHKSIRNGFEQGTILPNGEKLTRGLKVSKSGGFYRDIKKRDINIDHIYLEKQFKKQKGMCYWVPHYRIDLNQIFIANSVLAPSVDRLDGDEGYVKGNVVITTRFVNLGRNRDNDEVRFRDFLDEMFGKPVKIEKYI